MASLSPSAGPDTPRPAPAAAGIDGVTIAALMIVLGSAGALAAAWFFQLVIGLAPCPLCLDQRLPYYAAIPIGLLTALAMRRGLGRAGRAGLWVLLLLMLGNTGLAGYHAGIEWQFWPGPTACSGGAPTAVSDILSALKTAHVPRCDEAPWRLFGLSMAGWNAMIALTLAGIAIGGIREPD